MVNINKIKIFHINFNESIVPSTELFDKHVIYGFDFIGLSIDSKNLRDKLTAYDNCTSYGLDELYLIDNRLKTPIRVIEEYLGLNHEIDGILDIMLDEKLDIDRRFYLESILYYKSNQFGRPINKFTLNIKHFDDFYNNFSEDIISCDELEHNDDYSKSKIIIETHLTNEELIHRFKKYLIQ